MNNEASRQVTEIIDNVIGVIKLYGENPEQMKPGEFFELFYNFARDFSNTYKNVL